MKSLLISIILLPLLCFGQDDFKTEFTNKSLRIDFTIGGNAKDEFVILKSLSQEPYWGGNPKNITEENSKGDYNISISNLSGKIIYKKGFNSLFREWQTIKEAKNINRSFYHSIQLPYPINQCLLTINSRQKDGEYETLLKYELDPENYMIDKTTYVKSKVDTIIYAGNSSDNLDLAFIAEGYTKEEYYKFIKDVKRFKKWIFDVEPFVTYKSRVNIYSVFTPSVDSGPDIPGDYLYNNTLLNSSFYTFNSPRYLTIKDIEKMFDIASQVPYDHVYVIVNTDKYGGAGFYNNYTSCASDCRDAEEIASHELCHGLIGLADEYYSNNDEITYYYDLDIEPWEANITTLIDFKSKWEHLVSKNTPIPTPRLPLYESEIGAFEGAAYLSKGLFSPMQNCKMKSNECKVLCPACQEAVHKVMRRYISN